MARRTAVTLKRRRRRARPPRVEPVFTLLLTQLLPASEIAVPHGAVQVDHALFEALEQVEIQRALVQRSEEHTSELQSRLHLVCRLLLEKKKNNSIIIFSFSVLISIAV